MVSKFYDTAIRKIFAILSRNPGSQQYLLHSRNSLQWAERIHKKMFENGVVDKEKLDEVIKIATLGHDIEQVSANKIQINSCPNYLSYRRDSHKRSASIIRNILINAGSSEIEAERAFNAILQHESGGEIGSDEQLLCDADALSYCDVLIAFDYKKYLSTEDAIKKMRWEYKRMSKYAREFLINFHYAHIPNLNRIAKEVFNINVIDNKNIISDKV